MLPTTLVFFMVAQLSLPPAQLTPKCSGGSIWNASTKTCEVLEKYCGTRATWERSSQSCRALPPTHELCWADGQQLDSTGKSCVPLSLNAFCQERNWNYEQQQTVSRILNELNAHDCEEAESLLLKSRKLSLRSAGYLKIQDLRPLRALSFIEELNLDGQRISDLEPLQKFNRLKKLSIRNNDVYDLSPLLSLGQLETLDLSGNPILASDPALKALQKKMKVIFKAPLEAEAPGVTQGAGSIVEPD